MFYSIDFGTSNTVVTRWNDITQQPEVLTLPNVATQSSGHPPLIPSLLYVEDARSGRVTIGQSVCDRGLDLNGDPRFFRRFKRGIGNPVQGFLPELDERQINFEQVGDWFLSSIFDRLQSQDSTPIESLVLTVPVDSFESYRLWLSQVCGKWPAERVQLIDEPTAAALGYGTIAGKPLLVIDFGGGTLDLSLVQIDGNAASGAILKWGEKLLSKNPRRKSRIAKVLAKAGSNLGGTDIDDWILDYFIQSRNIPRSPLTLRLAERLKIQLSACEQAVEVYFDDRNCESYELHLCRDELQEILKKQQFFDELDGLMAQLLQQGQRNGIEREDIQDVLLIGGTVQIPAVQAWIEQYFNRQMLRRDRPFTAVALGALQLAQGMEVRDFLSHAYGIRYWNRRQNCHSWHPIIKAGQPYPMVQPVEIALGASVENQPSIELVIGELGSEIGRTEVYFDGGRLQTRSLPGGEKAVQPLNDRDGARTLARLDPLGQPGSDRLKVQFWIDSDRFLRIRVEDLLLNCLVLDNQIVAQLS